MPATLTVRLFASARTEVGRPTLLFDSVSSVGEALARLRAEYPKLAPLLPSCRLVLNGRYVDRQDAPIGPGDELAVHPPYSGG